MRINFWYKGVLVAATLFVAPTVLPASPRANQPSPSTVESSERSSPINPSNLLQQIQIDAVSVRNNADQLQARLRDMFDNDWESDSILLYRVRARVNDMDKLLSQLRANQSEARHWQQQAIGRIAPTVVNLTDTTQAAITTLNNNRAHIYFSDLKGLSGDIYNRASQISRAVENFEKYASARHEAQQLRQTLGLQKNS